MFIGNNIGVPILNVNRNSDSFLYQNRGMSIGERVREARKDAKLTQQQLAAKVSISQSTLSELENGESAGTAFVATMAAALGVSALWLETGKGPKKLDIVSASKSAAGTDTVPVSEIVDLLTFYGRCTPEWRTRIMDLARLGVGDQVDPDAKKN